MYLLAFLKEYFNVLDFICHPKVSVYSYQTKQIWVGSGRGRYRYRTVLAIPTELVICFDQWLLPVFCIFVISELSSETKYILDYILALINN